MMRLVAKVDITKAVTAFDMLGAEGPRTAARELALLATDVKVEAEAKAPGSLKDGWQVHALHDTDPGLPGQDFFGYLVAADDKERHAEKPVGRWVNYGTGDKSDKRAIRDGNQEFPGQRAQRYLRKVSRKRQVDAIHKAIVRAARRAGFTVTETL